MNQAHDRKRMIRLRRLAVAVVTLLVSANPLGRPLEAQTAGCQLGGFPGIVDVLNPVSGVPSPFGSGYANSVELLPDAQRLFVPMNYGFGIFDVTAPLPSSPALSWPSLRAQVGRQPGDGQSYVSGFGASPDGQRLVVNMNLNGTGYSNLVAVPTDSSKSSYRFVADFSAPMSADSTVVHQIAGRYIVYTLKNGDGLYAADITNIPGPWPPCVNPGVEGCQRIEYPNDMRLGWYPVENTGRAYGSDLRLARNLLVYRNGDTLEILDAGNPGPAPVSGGNPSITPGFTRKQVPLFAWGSVGTGERLARIEVAPDPSDGRGTPAVYVLGTFRNASAKPTAWRLIKYDFATDTATPVGQPFVPPAEFVGASASSIPLLGVLSEATKATFFLWAASATNVRVYLFTPDSWPTSSPNSNYSSFYDFGTGAGVPYPGGFVREMRAMRISATDVALFVPQTTKTYAMDLSNCEPQTGPAVSGLSASSTTPFIGDSVAITPVYSPPNDSSKGVGLVDWHFDFNFHTGEPSNTSWGGINRDDKHYLGVTVGTTEPSTVSPIQLAGPCDPNFSNSVPASGTSCWTSVGTGGSGDAPSAVLAPGSTVTTTLKFEVQNQKDSANTAQLPLVWKAPDVTLVSPNVITGSTTSVGIQTQGTPDALQSWYWYAGTSAASLSLVCTTTGATCTSPQAPLNLAAQGTYYVLVSVPYKNGYRTSLCAGSPTCTPGANDPVRTLTVADIVPAFTVAGQASLPASPTVVLTVTPSLVVGNQSNTSAGAASTSQYQYCWATSGTAAGLCTWQTLFATGAPKGTTADIASQLTLTPGTTYWLRIRARSGATATWIPWNPPGGSTGQDYWPVVVTAGAPGIRPVSGLSPCGGPGVGGGTCTNGYVNTGSAVTFALQLGGADATTVPPDLFWSINVVGGSASPPSQSLGLQFTVTPSSTYTTAAFVTVTAFGQQATYQFEVRSGTPPPTTGSCDFSVIDTSTYPSTTLGTTTTQTTYSISGPKTLLFQPLSYLSTYSWSLGTFAGSQSGFSPNQPFTHTFSSAGILFVTLDGVSPSCTKAVTINVTSSVTPEFRVSDGTGANFPQAANGDFLVPSGLPVTLTAIDAATGQALPSPVTPGWNFGDATSSSVTPAQKAWTVSGSATYLVTLTLGAKSVSHNVNVVPGIPTAAYSAVYGDGGTIDTAKVALNKAILFTSTGPPAAQYTWDFGDGTVETGPSAITHTYTRTGSFPVTLRMALGGVTFQTATPTTYSVVELPRWIVPGLAYAAGVLPGSFYISDVVIQNTSATQWASYSIALLDGQDPLVWVELPGFQPLESRRLSNVVNKTFGKNAGVTYAMVVRGNNVPSEPAIVAFTYNNNGADRATKGTYGTAISAVSASAAVGPNSPAAAREFPGLRDVPLTAVPNVSAAYTNVGFVNVGDVPATVAVRYVSRVPGDAGPTPLGNAFEAWLGPKQTKQLTQPLRQALAGTGQSYETYEAPNYYMAFEVLGEGAMVIPYATVKDFGSSDSVFLTSLPNTSSPVRVPSMVRVNRTTITGETTRTDRFRSRAVIFNPSEQSRAVKLSFSYRRCPPGVTDLALCDARTEMTGTVTLGSGETYVTEDFVQSWMAYKGQVVSDEESFLQSYLDVSPADANPDPLVVRGEAYNNQEGGNFGAQVPALLADVHGASAAGTRKRLVVPYVVPNAAQSNYYRTNVALVALGDGVAEARLRLREPFTGSGSPAISEQIRTINDKFLQSSLESIFPELKNYPVGSFPGPGYYSLEIEVTKGTLAAYVIINDNITSDGSLVLAQPLP